MNATGMMNGQSNLATSACLYRHRSLFLIESAGCVDSNLTRAVPLPTPCRDLSGFPDPKRGVRSSDAPIFDLQLHHVIQHFASGPGPLMYDALSLPEGKGEKVCGS